MLHELISRTYDVVSSQASAEELMGEIAEFFAVRAAALVVKQTGRPPRLVCYGAAAEIRGNDDFSNILRADLSDDKLNHLTDNCSNVVLNESATTTYIMIFNNVEAEHGGVELQMVALLPHVVRSIKLTISSNSDFPDEREAVDHLRNRLAPATIILDSDGVISDINAKAASLIQTCNVIRLVSDRIEFSDFDLAQRFRSGLSLLLADKSTEPFFMPIIEDEEEDNLVLLMKQCEESSQGVVIYLRSMRIPDWISPPNFSEKFELSPKESRLAVGLMQGKNLRHLAAEFHVSEHTLRTQLKSVLHKTGVNSQIALIVLMLSDATIGLDH